MSSNQNNEVSLQLKAENAFLLKKIQRMVSCKRLSRYMASHFPRPIQRTALEYKQTGSYMKCILSQRTWQHLPTINTQQRLEIKSGRKREADASRTLREHACCRN